MNVGTALAQAEPESFWLDDPRRPDPLPPLAGETRCDLAVVGGGYNGLWTALMAKEREPDRDVLVLEGRRIGWAASGRNGGFCEASLTHGLENGIAHFPDEVRTLRRLGIENLNGIESAIGKYGIDCSWERTGSLEVAVAEWQIEGLREYSDLAAEYGARMDYLDTDAVRAEVDSPLYLAGVWEHDAVAIVNPARLAWGLRDACLSLGVRIHEDTPIAGIEADGSRLALPGRRGGRVVADRIALATNGFRPLLRRVRPYLAPVYDYVLMTEPLSEAQLAQVGWRNRQGLSDVSNQFHYYRLTADNRILWGGYDAIYHYGNRISTGFDQRPESFGRIAEHFYQTFPQLADLRFTHKWGGVIDTCSRFCPFFGTAYRGRVAYAAGYTGLGVGATRFGAEVMLDLLDGRESELTELRMVRSRPLPFPPEPVKSAAVNATRWSLDRADRRGGHRNLWLRTLDRVGAGFGS